MGATRRRWRVRAAALTCAAVLAAAGCGGDDEGTPAADAGTTSAPAPPPTATVPAPGELDGETPAAEAPAAPPVEGDQSPEQASPEDRPGGAGDEEAVRSEVVITGRGGRVGPSAVKVPPFVAIRVRLRSADGKPYVITVGARTLKAGLGAGRSSATFDGLRPGRRLVGASASGKVVIEASAEPGP